MKEDRKVEELGSTPAEIREHIQVKVVSFRGKYTTSTRVAMCHCEAALSYLLGCVAATNTAHLSDRASGSTWLLPCLHLWNVHSLSLPLEWCNCCCMMYWCTCHAVHHVKEVSKRPLSMTHCCSQLSKQEMQLVSKVVHWMLDASTDYSYLGEGGGGTVYVKHM